MLTKMMPARMALALLIAAVCFAEKRAKAPQKSPIDKYIEETAMRAVWTKDTASPGSLYATNGRLSDAARDPRASQLDDIVTILVSDKASAVSKGTTNSARKSNATAGISSLAGPLKAAGPLANLAGMSGDQQLQGQGETTRESAVTTTLSARVIAVMPNGNLVIEGLKDIAVNSERQTISVRGVLRPSDLSAANVIASDRLANLEVRINGRGVVGDSVRRPFILYRLLMGLLPF